MAAPIIIPSPPSSFEMNEPPRTPVSPNRPNLSTLGEHDSQTPVESNGDSAQSKRKPSKRANTAERRASHNAVERARRETLNGRFMDLAALLPNLSQIRRPSKSSIVNSSIAHVHASRRHRLLASRELRVIKHEADALRRELNEWRTRAGLPRIEEPARGDGFAMILGAELEAISCVPTNEEEDEEQLDYYDDEYNHSRYSMATSHSMVKNANANPFAHNLPPASHNSLPPSLSRHASNGPMINSSAYGYEQGQGHVGAMPFIQQQPESEKWGQVYGGISNPQHQQVMAQRSLYTPPTSSHGIPSAPPSSHGSAPGNSFGEHQSYFLNMQRQQQLAAMQKQSAPQPARVYTSPETEDRKTKTEESRRREHSSSPSNGYASPTQASTQMNNYEVPSTPPVGVVSGEYSVPRRSSAPNWGPSDVLLKQNTSSGFSLMI